MTITRPQFLVTTSGLSDGWHNLGTVTVTGTASGRNVANSPHTAAVWVYIGDVDRIYLPVVLRNH